MQTSVTKHFDQHQYKFTNSQNTKHKLAAVTSAAGHDESLMLLVNQKQSWEAESFFCGKHMSRWTQFCFASSQTLQWDVFFVKVFRFVLKFCLKNIFV